MTKFVLDKYALDSKKSEAKAKIVSKMIVHFLLKEAERTAARAKAAGPLCMMIPNKTVLSLWECPATRDSSGIVVPCDSKVPSRKAWINRPSIKVITPLEVSELCL